MFLHGSVCPQGGSLGPHPGGGEGSGWGGAVGVSRPTPGGRLEGLAGGGSPVPRLRAGSPGPGWGGGGVSQHALRQTPPQQTAIAAGSAHLTGMHSCVICVRCSCTCQILISKQFYIIKLLRPFENTLHFVIARPH